jgi:hypothetical protein
MWDVKGDSKIGKGVVLWMQRIFGPPAPGAQNAGSGYVLDAKRRHRTVVRTVGVMESTQVLTCIVPLDLNYLQPAIFLTTNWLRRSLLR